MSFHLESLDVAQFSQCRHSEGRLGIAAQAAPAVIEQTSEIEAAGELHPPAGIGPGD